MPRINIYIAIARSSHKPLLVEFWTHPRVPLLVITDLENGALADSHKMAVFISYEKGLFRVAHRIYHGILRVHELVAIYQN